MALPRLRPIQWAAIILAALVVAASLAPIAWDIWHLDDLMVRGRSMVGRDFVNSWAGGHLAVQGRAAEIYSADYMPMVRELRRVARRRLIIVVPQEREYRFTFNPHVHFFPYPHSFLRYMAPIPDRYRCESVGRDIYYVEVPPAAAETAVPAPSKRRRAA